MRRSVLTSGCLFLFLFSFWFNQPLYAAPLGQETSSCEVLLQEGNAFEQGAEYDSALQRTQEALACYQEKADPVGESQSASQLGRIYEALGQYEEALVHYNEALGIYEQIEDPMNQWSMLYHIGLSYLNSGQGSEALSAAQQARQISQEIADSSAEAVALWLMATIEANQGQYEEAVAHYNEMLTISRQIEDEDRVNERLALRGIGSLYVGIEQYEEGLPYLEEELTIVRELQLELGTSEALLINLIGLSHFNLAQYDKALSHYSEARTIFRQVENHTQETVILNNIGDIYFGRGQYDEAFSHYQESLTLSQEIEAPDLKGLALKNIAQVYLNRGQYDQALQHLEQVLAIRDELDEGEDGGKAAILSLIGQVYAKQAKYDQALDYHEQALIISREIASPSVEATARNDIGLVYLSRAEYQSALDYFNQALEIHREIDDLDGLTSVTNNMGQVYLNLGQYKKALESFEQALQISQEIEDRAGEATASNSIGTVYFNLGQYESALESFEQALQIHKDIDNHAGKATTLNNIGSLHFDLAQYEMALEYYDQALQIHRDIGNRAVEATTLNNIGSVYDDWGEYQEALEYYDQALEISKEIGHRSQQATTLNNMGTLSQEFGQLDTAVAHYEEAIALVEQIRGEITVDEFKSGFSSNHVELYAQFIDLLVELGRSKEAFHYVQRAKARSFLDQLGNGPLDIRAGVEADLLEKEGQLRSRIKASRDQIVKLSDQKDNNSRNQETINEVQEELRALEEQYEGLLIEIKAASPETASLVSVDVASLEEVQALLDPNTTLVEYFMSDKQTLIFVISATEMKMVVSDVSREEVTSQVSDFRSALNFYARKPELAAEESKRLYSWFIEPIADSLSSNLLIAPHSVLHYLPFSALTNGEDYLLDEVSLATLPSASTLRFIKEKRKSASGELLALGNPTTALDPLPFAGEEVGKIAELYGAESLIEQEATEEAIWEQGGQANIIHIAAHGEYNHFNPSFSTLHLATGSEHDGRLEVHEIYGLDLTQATNLVVLSACETQLPASGPDNETISGGDEIVALNRALLYAGTPSVIASLWNVNDKATALLMERFYTHLAKGEGPAYALRQAQQALRAHEKYSHPYYWAAFVLSGDSGDVPSTTLLSRLSSGPWLLLSGALLLLIVGLVGFTIMQRRPRTTTTGAPIAADESLKRPPT